MATYVGSGTISTTVTDWVAKWNALIANSNERLVTVQTNVVTANTSVTSPTITATTLASGPTIRATTLLNARATLQLGSQSIANTATIWTSSNDGAGSGLDADTLDGQQAAAFQPVNANLTSLSLLGTAANRMAYTTGVGVWAEATISSFARTLLDDADNGAARTTLGLTIGTDVQAYDADLAAIAGLTSAADRLPYFTGSATAALAVFTSFARTLLDDADASTARSTLELGSLATLSSASPSNVTFSATSRLLGRKTASGGPGEEVTLSELLDFIGSAAQGDILYRGASSWVRLAAGTSGQFLKTNGPGANPAWADGGGGAASALYLNSLFN